MAAMTAMRRYSPRRSRRPGRRRERDRACAEGENAERCWCNQVQGATALLARQSRHCGICKLQIQSIGKGSGEPAPHREAASGRRRGRARPSGPPLSAGSRSRAVSGAQGDDVSRRPGRKVGPAVHQIAAFVEQVGSPVGRFGLVWNDVRQRRF